MANAATYGLSQLFEESVSAVTLTNSIALGTRRHSNGCDWLYVYNGNTQEYRPGRAVRLASGSTGYTVDVAAAAQSTVTVNIGLGVVVNATVASSAYFWLLTRGFAQVETLPATSALVAGEQLGITTSGTVFALNTCTSFTSRFIKPFGVCAQDEGATTNTQSFTAYIYGF